LMPLRVSRFPSSLDLAATSYAANFGLGTLTRISRK
jgi:hypothetical protein